VLLLASCTNLPARPVSIVAARQGPSHVLWTYLSSVADMTPDQRNQHLRDFEEQRRLPISVTAEPGEFLWIVPVCDGQPQWTKAEAIQVPLDASAMPISC
jgi:hypothetical protein